jgi:hypothetical protein
MMALSHFQLRNLCLKTEDESRELYLIISIKGSVVTLKPSSLLKPP